MLQVYLAQDVESSRLFALKKIRCPLPESVRAALNEVEASRKFRHPNIIRCLDSCVVQDKEGDGKIIYLFLPYYKNGTVQGIIAANAVTLQPSSKGDMKLRLQLYRLMAPSIRNERCCLSSWEQRKLFRRCIITFQAHPLHHLPRIPRLQAQQSIPRP